VATTINERGGVSVNAAFIKCQRCGNGPELAHQITGPNGYVQLCYVCLGMIDAHVAHYWRTRDAHESEAHNE
jgi:hypothetical protein